MFLEKLLLQLTIAKLYPNIKYHVDIWRNLVVAIEISFKHIDLLGSVHLLLLNI